MRAHLEGLLEEGLGPVAEPGSDWYSMPGAHPFDRLDKSAASETRSAGSYGEDKHDRFHSGV